jgi:hypothetical protein
MANLDGLLFVNHSGEAWYVVCFFFNRKAPDAEALPSGAFCQAGMGG